METRRYGYGNNKWVGPVCTLLGLPLAWYFYHCGMNGAAFKFHGMNLTGQSALYAYWIFSALMGLVFLGGVVITTHRISGEDRYVEITLNGIATPRMPLMAPMTYNFKDISSVNELDFGRGKRHIRFKTRYGTGMLSRAGFDDKNDFDEVLALLRERAPGAPEH